MADPFFKQNLNYRQSIYENAWIPQKAFVYSRGKLGNNAG